MTKEQLKIWFLDKYNSCNPSESKNKKNIFLYYDINYIRSKKLANILNKDVEYPTEVKDVCLFILDFKNKYLWCDYDEIWSFFEQNYSSTQDSIGDLIKDFLVEDKKINGLLPIIKLPLY